MGLSKRHLDRNTQPVSFDPDLLGEALDRGLPDVLFALLLGSAVNGTVKPHSDLDLALFHGNSVASPGALLLQAQEICERVVGPVRCDVGILNRAEPVYRFESLKGRLLCCRNREIWLDFYSLTCREYEHQLFHYRKQHAYRLEYTRAVPEAGPGAAP